MRQITGDHVVRAAALLNERFDDFLKVQGIDPDDDEEPDDKGAVERLFRSFGLTPSAINTLENSDRSSLFGALVALTAVEIADDDPGDA
jgi:hypothetical protein